MQDGQKSQADVALGSGKKETPQATYTKEQVEKMVTDARTAVMADAKRFQVEAEKSLKAAQAAQERLNKMEQERIDAEIETHRDDPAEIKRIRAEQKARQLESDLAKEREVKTEYENRLKTIEAQISENTKSSVAQSIAQKFNVDVEKLSTLAKLTDGSDKAIEALAQELPKKSTSFKPDSNRGVGGMLSWEEIRDAYIKDPYNPTNRERYEAMRPEHSVVRK